MNTDYWGYHPLENNQGSDWANLILQVPNLTNFLALGLDSTDGHERYAAAHLFILGCPYWPGPVKPFLEKARAHILHLMTQTAFLAQWPDRILILTEMMKTAGHLNWRLDQLNKNQALEIVGGSTDSSERIRRVLAARLPMTELQLEEDVPNE